MVAEVKASKAGDFAGASLATAVLRLLGRLGVLSATVEESMEAVVKGFRRSDAVSVTSDWGQCCGKGALSPTSAHQVDAEFGCEGWPRRWWCLSARMAVYRRRERVVVEGEGS